MPQRILSELQALAAETRRKHPEVRHAAEQVLQQVQSSDHATTLASLGHDVAADQALVRPIVLACKTRAPKVVLIALSLLQRSVVLHLLPPSSLSEIVDALHGLLTNVARTDVDVQLKILQTVPALLADYPSITSALLSNTLMLCFTLYEQSRVTVVSLTAAATLRQNIMTVFDKVHDEDRTFDAIKDGGEDAAAAAPLPVHTAHTPDGNVTLFPASSDAYFLLNDLCALANGEPASFLPLHSLSKPFVLELLESVLTNHARLFAGSSPKTARHPELLYVLRSAACPFLLKALSEPPAFPVFVRIMRLVLLLLRQFSEELVLEIEILLRMILKTLQGSKSVPLWHRVLALEVLRSLCADGYFMRRVYRWYDAGDAGPVNVPATPLFADVVTALTASLTELQPHLSVDATLTAAHQQIPEQAAPRPSQDKSYTLYGAASAAVAGVRNAAEGLLSTRTEALTANSAPAIQLLDQLDKTEAPAPGSPPLPSTYLPLLVLWSHVLLAQSLALYVLRRYAEVYAHVEYAPPALPASDDLAHVTAMLQMYARPANDALAFFLTVQGTDYVYDQALLALANLGQAVGAVGLARDRDAVLATLSDLGLPSAALQGRTLSARSWACQLALGSTAIALAGSLGERWRTVLQTTATALSFVPSERTDGHAPTTAAAPRVPSGPGMIGDEVAGKAELHFLARSALEPGALYAALDHVFGHSVWLADEALAQFVTLLAQLTAERARDGPPAVVGVLLDEVQRVVLANTQRIAAQLPEGAWGPIAEHLFALIEAPDVSAAYRTHAARVLDAIAYGVLRAVPSTAHARQRTLLAAIDRQARAHGRTSPTDVAVRKAAIDLLLRVLETHAHRLQAGWDMVFGMCRAAAEAAPEVRAQGTSPLPLLKVAFVCVQLICSEHLAALSNEELELCIACLPSFCTQTEDTNLALTANGVLWDITADVHRRQATSSAESMSALWLFVLHRMRDTAEVPHADVRNGAIANLFQVLVQYSSALHPGDWQRIFFEILYPLCDAASGDTSGGSDWDASHTLVLQGTARILDATVLTLANDAAFAQIWSMFVTRVVHTYRTASAPVAQTALDALLKVLRSSASAPPLRAAWHETWDAWVAIGTTPRADLTLTDLVTVVALLEPLYAAKGTDLDSDQLHVLLRTLEQCVEHGIAHGDVGSTKQLYTLVGGVHKALERLPARDEVPALRLHSLAVYVRCALDAAAETSLAPPLKALRVQLAEDLLLYWQTTYLADPKDAALYQQPVLTMLDVLRAPLQHGDIQAPPLASLARDTLYHISHLGAPVVSRRAQDISACDFYARVFACMHDVLTARALSSTRTDRDAIEVQTFPLLVALERDVLPTAGADADAYDTLRPFLADLVDATQLHTRNTLDPEHGSLLPIDVSQKERVAYWTYDLLFALCRVDASAQVGRRLLCVLVLPLLLAQCARVLTAYASDVAVRGKMPLPRVRLEEVNYVLHQLIHLRLAQGTLRIALRTRDPATAFAALQTYTPPTQTLPIQEMLQQSPVGHLFYLHKELDRCAALTTTQQGTIGTSLAPLDLALFPKVDKALLARATRVPTARTTPTALALQTQTLRSDFLQ